MLHSTVVQSLLILAAFVSSAGLFTPSQAAINKPIRVNEAPSRDQSDVLIYYSNETAPDPAELKNYQTIMGWLRLGNEKVASRIVGQLESDLREFRAAVDQETAAIVKAFVNLPPGDTSAALIFTNRLARDGKYEIIRPGHKDVGIGKFPRVRNSDLILNSNPLGTGDGLRSALQVAAKEFDPTQHNFVLVTKSHGKRNLALTPRLAVLSLETNKDEILKVARADGELQENTPAWVMNRRGTKKSDYFQILSEMGAKYQLFVSVLFMESCASEDLNGEDNSSRSKNIGLLFTTAGATPYRTLDYEYIIGQTGSSGKSISGAFAEALESKSDIVHPIADSKPISKYWYYVPLLLMCVYSFGLAFLRMFRSGSG